MNNVVMLTEARARVEVQRTARHLRRELILQYKNPLLKLSREGLLKEKHALSALITKDPANITLRVKWQMLNEVASDVL